MFEKMERKNGRVINLLATAYNMGALNPLKESISIERCSDSSVDAIRITIAEKVVKIVHACDDDVYITMRIPGSRSETSYVQAISCVQPVQSTDG